MIRNRSIFVIVMIFAFAVAGIPTAAQEGEGGPARVGLRPDAPMYALHGPYWVGARDDVIDQGAEDALTITVWYPATNADGAEEAIIYEIADTAPIAADFGPGLTVVGHALPNATPDSAEAPYPLVVFSPGVAVWRQAETYILEHLVSHGFVAIALDHRGETLQEFWLGSVTRPADVKRVIAYADTLTASEGALEGLIDIERIGVIGHSSGGWTALAAGGAQMNLGGCADLMANAQQNPFSYCPQLVPHQEEMARLLGLDGVQGDLWPATNDPRVDAVVSLAPNGEIWGENYEGVSVISVPTLVMGGSEDTTNTPDLSTLPIYAHLGSSQKALVMLEDAGHSVFMSPCQDTPWLAAAGLYFFCSDPVWDMDRAHDLTNHFTTAFLLDVLKGDAEAHATLLPDAVSFPGITYDTTMH